MKTSETLNLAADLIEQHGWETGPDAWGWGKKGLCLEGGILAAIGFPVEPNAIRPWFNGRGACPAFDAVCDHLGIDGDLEKPWEWNDAPERTAAEVIEVLRATAVIEAARNLDRLDEVRELWGRQDGDPA